MAKGSSTFHNGRMLLTEKKNFVWTEAMGCAPVLAPSLESFLRHHKQPINVFMFDDDEFTNPNPERVFEIRVPRDGYLSSLSGKELAENYLLGHAGTARLWAWIFSSVSGNSLIHLDGDNIYVGNVLDELELELEASVIAGYRRPQFRHPAPMPLWQRLLLFFARDTVHTFAFGVQTKVIQGFSENQISSLILGRGVPRFKSGLAPVVDFFDRACLEFGAGHEIGFMGELTASHAKRGAPSNGLFARKVLSFSAVGSGYSFLTRGHEGVPLSYVNHAMASFALYASEFMVGQFSTPEPLDSPELASQLARLNKRDWVLEID